MDETCAPPSWLVFQHEPVSRFAGAEVVEGGVHVVHCEGLGDWRDLMAGAEIQHFHDGGGRAERGAGDRLAPADQGKGSHWHRLQHRADEVQTTIWRQRGDEETPIERDVGGDEDKVERAAQFRQCGLVAGADDVVGAEFAGFVRLGFAGGEGGDLAAPFVEELQRQVTQSADADHADAVGRLDPEIDDGAEDCDSPAEQRTGARGI